MVQVKIDLSRAKQKLSNQAMQRGRNALGNQALADMNQFVPMKEGILRQTGHVEGDATSIIWSTPYASKMFYMPMYNYTTPGTGPRWDNKAKSIFMSSWVEAFTKGAGW